MKKQYNIQFIPGNAPKKQVCFRPKARVKEQLAELIKHSGLKTTSEFFDQLIPQLHEQTFRAGNE